MSIGLGDAKLGVTYPSALMVSYGRVPYLLFIESRSEREGRSEVKVNPVLLRSLSIKGSEGQDVLELGSLGTTTVEKERPGVPERAQTKRSKVL